MTRAPDREMVLSVVVIAFDMARELPRTVRSLTRPYQQGIGELEYEIVVVDNGSTVPVDAAAIEAISPDVRVVRFDGMGVSPAGAVNRAVAATSGRFVGVVLDGARMVTPGLVALALEALSIDEDALVTPLAWHLGPSLQSLSMRQGYSQQVEDELLEGIGWPSDGYRLFEIAALAAANREGWFGPMNESCAAFLSRESFDDLGGYDEGFTSPGGGYVTLDFFSRAVGRRRGRLCVLLGEGSFHQIHGGVATNAGDPGAVDREFAAEYERLRGRPFRDPVIAPFHLGRLPPELVRWTAPAVAAGRERDAEVLGSPDPEPGVAPSRRWRRRGGTTGR